MARLGPLSAKEAARCDGSERTPTPPVSHRERCPVCGRSYRVRADGLLPVHHLPADLARIYNGLAAREGW